jgi:hypothetical protein
MELGTAPDYDGKLRRANGLAAFSCWSISKVSILTSLLPACTGPETDIQANLRYALLQTSSHFRLERSDQALLPAADILSILYYASAVVKPPVPS